MTDVSSGIEPTLRALQPGNDSGLFALMAGCFVVNAVCFPALMRLWQSFFKQLLRRRIDDPQGESTLSERLALAISLIQTLVFEGLMLYCATGMPSGSPLLSSVGLILLAALLMLFQTGGYLATGYAFATPAATRSWLRSFMITQSIFGYLLIIPTMGALFYPHYLHAVLLIAGGFYVGCLILFYIKAFAFFYTSPASLFYFFLYLCTLEIVPLAVTAAMAATFSALFC